jgi:hypothetical protein
MNLPFVIHVDVVKLTRRVGLSTKLPPPSSELESRSGTRILMLCFLSVHIV